MSDPLTDPAFLRQLAKNLRQNQALPTSGRKGGSVVSGAEIFATVLDDAARTIEQLGALMGGLASGAGPDRLRTFDLLVATAREAGDHDGLPLDVERNDAMVTNCYGIAADARAIAKYAGSKLAWSHLINVEVAEMMAATKTKDKAKEVLQLAAVAFLAAEDMVKRGQL